MDAAAERKLRCSSEEYFIASQMPADYIMLIQRLSFFLLSLSNHRVCKKRDAIKYSMDYDPTAPSYEDHDMEYDNDYDNGAAPEVRFPLQSLYVVNEGGGGWGGDIVFYMIDD
jgi:hypothetical protein